MSINSIQKINTKLANNRLFYVCRDIERAQGGLFLDIPNYHIITNTSPLSLKLKKTYKNQIHIINKEETLDTWEILKQTDIITSNDHVLVFKNTLQIEKTCLSKKWTLLNPSAVLSNKIEEKISQIEWLGELKKYLPGYEAKECKNINWEQEKFILQFNRSHTGSGTVLIENKDQLEKIKEKFPNRPARIARYIKGPLFTNNNIIAKDKILIGNISYQITGLLPFTDKQFATIGNDWAFPHEYLNENQIKKYNKIVKDIGKKLQESGWKGLFGVDIVEDEKTKELFLLEINARQPASTTFESELQKNSLTTFEAHLMSLLDIDIEDELTEIRNGAQIIFRNQIKKIKTKNTANKLKEKDFSVIIYNNDKPNSDLLRIQSKDSVIKNHNLFNTNGEDIKNIIKQYAI